METRPRWWTREQWLIARKALLEQEQERVRVRDRVNAERRRLPMVRIGKPYTLTGPDGTVGLLDLFEGRQQMVMHHFMWTYDTDADGNEQPQEHACPSCSSAADMIPAHL